jgi:excisionase family DNA binding protein
MKPELVAVSVRDAATCLGLGYVTTWSLVTSGELRSFKVGNRRLVPVDAIKQFVDQRLHEQNLG